MRCPFCGNVDTQVKDSRPAEDHVAIRRRRFCPACGGRFTTYERVQLRDLIVDKTWYGYAIAGGYTWVEYYGAQGDAYYLDDSGFIVGTWDVRSEKEVCFDYPTLGSFCFAVYQTPSGQVAIYDMEEQTLIHMTTRIVDGDPEGLARQPKVGDMVGD